MPEGETRIGPDYGQGRLPAILQEARQAKAEGLNRRQRRERVISQVAKPALNLESAETQETAIHKYWEIIPGSGDIHALIVAPHGIKSNRSELLSQLREQYPDRERVWLEGKIDEWLQAPKGEKPHKTLPETDPRFPIFAAIAAARDHVDPHTDELAKAAADGGGERVWVALAKKSRMRSDANRSSWFHKPRGSAEGEPHFLQTREFPTSVRASMYWVATKAVEATVGIDEQGHAKEPFLQLVVHGMSDRVDKTTQDRYDIVIGGGSTRKGTEGWLANPKVLRWFSQRLAQELHQQAMTVPKGEGVEPVKVVIDWAGKPNVEAFQVDEAGEVEKTSLPRIGVGLSGKGLGLEYFRTGHVYRETTVDKETPEPLPDLQFPGFGVNFQTVQLELSNALRTDPVAMEKLAGILHTLSKEFQTAFTPENLTSEVNGI